MAGTWPSLEGLLDGAVAYRIPLTVGFRGLREREGLVVRGPSGWGEFAPFPDYSPDLDRRWLEATIEASWDDWPAPRRRFVPVNAIVPAVGPELAAQLVLDSGCSTAKVKVGQAGQGLDADIARVAAVRRVLGPTGRLRIDVNGAWTVGEAVERVTALAEFDLEYVEQPCRTLGELAEVRRKVSVRLAVDESVRQAVDPIAVAGVADAADVLVLKVAPLGGVAAALRVAAAYALPVVVSSALESSVGLSAGVALAAALSELPFACGLGTGRLLSSDVTDSPVLPKNGKIATGRASVDPECLAAVRAPEDSQRRWRERATVAYQAAAQRRSISE